MNKSKSPNSTGRGSEIIVVCSKQNWNGPVGNTVRGALTQNMPGLPEAEPEFTLINIPPKDFSKFLQSHRNVLVIDIKDGNKKSKVETLRNVWSHPQRVIKVIASSDTAFFNLLAKHSEAIKELFNQNERARFSAQNALSRNLVVEKLLEDDFGIKMVISKDFYQAKKTTDFVWLRSEATTMSLGLMIYTYPYRDTALMNPAAVLAYRDKYTRRHIPGPLDGSYMAVEREAYPPVTRRILFKNMYAIETRGLWKTVGDFMGGPFVNYTIVDAPRQRIIVFDGYIYNPNKSKRNYIRQLESVIWGAEFGEPGKK
ncbi:MAG: DUF4837 family protein [Bacteroidales bacterium]|nr:DUF4837 family protein [Bacteroidales bacterium]